MAAATSPSPESAIPSDLPCTKCGYNLRTLSPASLCPECGTPAQETVEFVKGLSHYSLRVIAVGAGMLALQAVLTLAAEWMRVRLAGRMTFESYFDSDIAIVFGMFLSGSMLLAGVILLLHSLRVPCNRASTRRIYAGCSLAGLYFAVQIWYVVNYFHFNKVPGSWGWGAMAETFFLHERGSSRFNPGDGMMSLPWILYATELEVVGLLAFVTRGHLLEFASQTRLPRLARLTRVVLGFLCLLLFLRGMEIAFILAFVAGEHTLSPLVWVLTSSLPAVVRQIAWYVCLVIQAVYFTTLAIFTWGMYHRFRRSY